MTAEQFLKSKGLVHVDGQSILDVPVVWISKAMEEYTQQEAEAFAEWIEEKGWFKAVLTSKWICFATDEKFTTSELYQEYLKDYTKDRERQFEKESIPVNIDNYIYLKTKEYEYPKGEPNLTSNILHDELINFYLWLKSKLLYSSVEQQIERQIFEGKKTNPLLDIIGKWPGNETDEKINELLNPELSQPIMTDKEIEIKIKGFINNHHIWKNGLPLFKKDLIELIVEFTRDKLKGG